MAPPELSRVRKEEVLAFLAQAGPGWSEAIRHGQARLFCSEREWPAHIARLLALDGRGARHRRLLFDVAERIVDTPAREYRTPSEMVDAQTTLLATKLDPQPHDLAKLREMTLAAVPLPDVGSTGRARYLR